MTERSARPTPRHHSDYPDIVVSVGTDYHAFDRLIRWVDDYARRHRELRFLVQHGHSRAPRKANGVPFLPNGELGEAMRRARVVVTHGGPGTIIQARGAGRLPVVLARDPELDEHVDLHQLLFVERLEQAGRVRSCSSPQQLSALIDRALASPESFRVRPRDGGEGEERAGRRTGELIDLLTETTGEPRTGPAAELSADSYVEDYETLLRLARRGPIRNTPEPGVRTPWHRRPRFSGRWQTMSTALRWLLEHYPEFRLMPYGYARVSGQIAFAEASAGHRRPALRWIGATLRHRFAESRAYLAFLVVCGVPPGWILRALRLCGKGL